MRRFFGCLMFMAAITLIAGCEWDSSDGGSSWSSSYSWINFSGVYRPVAGKTYLVEVFAPVTTSPASTQTTTESIGTGDGLKANFSGTLGNTPITLGSVSVTAGGFSLTDPDGDGQMASADGAGTINYQTGSISVNWTFAPGPGENVLVTYTYNIDGSTSNPQPGSTLTIYSLALEQTGNVLNGSDNNGMTYSGQISGLAQGGGDSTGMTSGQVVANITMTGSDGSQIVGTLTGQYNAPSTSTDTTTTSSGGTGSLNSRTLQGTYVNTDGSTGDIVGSAGGISTTNTFSGTNTTAYVVGEPTP